MKKKPAGEKKQQQQASSRSSSSSPPSSSAAAAERAEEREDLARQKAAWFAQYHKNDDLKATPAIPKWGTPGVFPPASPKDKPSPSSSAAKRKAADAPAAAAEPAKKKQKTAAEEDKKIIIPETQPDDDDDPNGSDKDEAEKKKVADATEVKAEKKADNTGFNWIEVADRTNPETNEKESLKVRIVGASRFAITDVNPQDQVLCMRDFFTIWGFNDQGTRKKPKTLQPKRTSRELLNADGTKLGQPLRVISRDEVAMFIFSVSPTESAAAAVCAFIPHWIKLILGDVGNEDLIEKLKRHQDALDGNKRSSDRKAADDEKMLRRLEKQKRKVLAQGEGKEAKKKPKEESGQATHLTVDQLQKKLKQRILSCKIKDSRIKQLLRLYAEKKLYTRNENNEFEIGKKLTKQTAVLNCFSCLSTAVAPDAQLIEEETSNLRDENYIIPAAYIAQLKFAGVKIEIAHFIDIAPDKQCDWAMLQDCRHNAWVLIDKFAAASVAFNKIKEVPTADEWDQLARKLYEEEGGDATKIFESGRRKIEGRGDTLHLLVPLTALVMFVSLYYADNQGAQYLYGPAIANEFTAPVFAPRG
jgi:hypothetical protein